MPLKPPEWHKRFALQAGWTLNTRQYLFNLAGIKDTDAVLDVGCGTGVLTAESIQLGIRQSVGIDLDPQFIKLAADKVAGASFTISDAHHLPFEPNTFDISFTHFVLMWVADPLSVLVEMGRVTKPGSAVLALAEPDYRGRIDYPLELEAINRWQSAGIQKLGGDPYFGRRLKELFHQAGFEHIEVGVIGAQWKGAPSDANIESEWQVIRHDLEVLGNKTSEQIENSETLREIDLRAWAEGKRILYVPIFYAIGRIQSPEGTPTSI